MLAAHQQRRRNSAVHDIPVVHDNSSPAIPGLPCPPGFHRVGDRWVAEPFRCLTGRTTGRRVSRPRNPIGPGGSGAGWTGATDPIYDPGNPDQVLHLDDTFSRYSTVAELETLGRADNASLYWGIRDSGQYLSLLETASGFGHSKAVVLDWDADPPVGGTGPGAKAQCDYWVAHGSVPHWYKDGSYATCSGAVNRGLEADDISNSGADKDCLVREVVYSYNRQGTPDAYPSGYSGVFEGKDWDWGGGAVRRWLQEVSRNVLGFENYDLLGPGGPYDPDTDPLCSLDYSNGGATALRAGLHTTSEYYRRFGPQIHIVETGGADPQMPYTGGTSAGELILRQNLNWGTGDGQFDWMTNYDCDGGAAKPGDGTVMMEKTRYTRSATSDHGEGRVEKWVGTAALGEGSLLKIMEYDGGAGVGVGNGKYEGLIYTRPSTESMSPSPYTNDLYDLSSNGMKGGCKVYVWAIRMWGHTRGGS